MSSGGLVLFSSVTLPIIHLRKFLASVEANRNDSIVIISRLYKSTAPPLENKVHITSSSLNKPSLKIDLMWLFILPENTPNKSAISQADIQTGVVGICTFPFSPMVMISLFIAPPPYYIVIPLNCSILLSLSESAAMSRLSFSWVILA